MTNTNQNAAFLRNPARDAVIAIDGVYSNPAGIAFLPQGFHMSVSWQAAFQKRQMDATNTLFQLNSNNQSSARFFEGTAKAPVIPSIQFAYVINDKWSVSAQFAVGGGGGKCEFDEGLPMFEEMIGGSVYKNGGTSYEMMQHLTGEQYFYGFQVGGTYRLTENFAVFGGVRGILANCSYTGAIENMKVNGNDAAYYAAAATQLKGAAEQYAAAGMTEMAAQYTALATQAATTAGMIQDYTLDCSQKDFGFTPIIGVDWNLGKLNLAAKYEFRTKINLENTSHNSANVDALMAAYKDGAYVRSDIPAILSLGAQYEVVPAVRLSAGFHYYWDKDAKGTPIVKGDNTWEGLLGVEWDVNDKILLSCGAQRTQYGFDDEDMADSNFNISSTALCVGGAYKFSDKMKLNVGYMHSFYGNHEFTRTATGTVCDYTRKNDVVGVSLDIRF